ncbi:MAG: heme response regulator HssR, partial [Clostridia bacterium]|nr:heme response regulator HssR [Clostridia bacterium]
MSIMVNILLVDDNEKIRKLMEIYLKQEGYHVLHAENGEKALEVLVETNADLIILDIMMPKMGGYDLTKELRDAQFNMPILMVTAKDTFTDKKTGFGLGVD